MAEEIIENHKIDIMDIEVKIGYLLINIHIDSSFFFSDDGYNLSYTHNHPNFEVHFILEGKGVMVVDGTDFFICENMCCLIGPGIYHSQIEESGEHILKYCMKFQYENLKNNEYNFHDDETDEILRVLSETHLYFSKDFSENIDLINKIQNEIYNKSIGYYSKIQSYFAEIIINIIRLVSSGTKNIYEIKEKSLYKKRSTIIDSFFATNYQYNASIDELSRMLCISTRQLDRVLKSMYGFSFKQKMLQTRIEVAKDLLTKTTLPLQTISERIGYDSITNFIFIFKKKTGMTPIAFKRKHSRSSFQNYPGSKN